MAWPGVPAGVVPGGAGAPEPGWFTMLRVLGPSRTAGPCVAAISGCADPDCVVLASGLDAGLIKGAVGDADAPPEGGEAEGDAPFSWVAMVAAGVDPWAWRSGSVPFSSEWAAEVRIGLFSNP